MRIGIFIILLLSFLNGFCQTESEYRDKYPDCIQFSPLFLLEPYTTCLNFSLEHTINSKTYIAGSAGYIFNANSSSYSGYPTYGYRLSVEIIRGIWKKEKYSKKRTRIFLGLEPYLKYVKSEEKHLFSEIGEDGRFKSPVQLYEYTCERQQLGLIVKGVLKHTHKRFSLNLEIGGRMFYKIVTQGDVDLNLYYNPGFQEWIDRGLYWSRFNGLTAMPFLNVKLGRLF